MTPRILDVSELDYRADRIGYDRPSLNQSIAHILLSESPLHAWQAHPSFGGGRPDEATPDMDRGSLIHTLVLGKGATVHVIQADDFRTKLAKEARDEARASGLLPVLERKYAAAMDVASRLTVTIGPLLKGKSEMMLAWEEDEDGRGNGGNGGTLCRAMLDHFDLEAEGGPTVYDLKTCRSANPRTVARGLLDAGGDVQAAAYTRAIEALHPDDAGRVQFCWIFVETEPPYAVTLARPDNVIKQLGEVKWLRAVETWARCLASGTWPAYGEGIQTLSPPPWAVAELEREVVDAE